jgi:hypothetical protein
MPFVFTLYYTPQGYAMFEKNNFFRNLCLARYFQGYHATSDDIIVTVIKHELLAIGFHIPTVFNRTTQY